MDTPNLPMRLLTSMVMPVMAMTTGSLLFEPSTASLSITPCAVTASSERSNVPVITMPLKSIELPCRAVATGAILDVELVVPL
ncbi:hypothetical protein D3C73_970900 [compost metagenome]